MTDEIKIVLGLIATVVGLLGYVPYYRDIFRGTTKPHPFTWLGFGLLTLISVAAQYVRGGGPGLWVGAVSAICIFGIAFLAFQRGEKNFTKFDWFCFGGALVGIALWAYTANPLAAVIIITITDNLAFAPTYRKGYLRPNEETASLFAVSAIKYAISLFALSSFNWTTALYPASLVIANMAFVAVILARRKIVH